jgi:hypothetical protein
VRVPLLLLFGAVLVLGDTFKLYLKEGGYHVVREYSVQGDRVRYFSTERGEWEEIPKELVDLAHTEAERKARSDAEAHEAKEEAAEDKAERDLRKEIASVPKEPGAYFNTGSKIETIPPSDYQIITNKKRRTLQILSPVPLVPGKASVVIKGEHASFSVSDDKPNFYLRLEKQQRFGIIKLTPKKDLRVVENVSIAPVVKQATEERKQIETFEQDLGNSLFKVWPEKPLEPGEYALIEYESEEDSEVTDVKTDITLLLWAFAVRP